jgi:hypothetical protein
MPEQREASALRAEMTICRYWIALPAARTGHLYATGISGPVQTSLRRYTVTRDAGREAPDSDHAKLAGADFGKHGGHRRVDRRNIIGFPDRLFWPVLIVRMTDYASSESAPCSKNRSLPSSSRLLSTSAVFSLISFSIICVIVHPK